ncbi:MAG: aldehyde dehydrogenase (NADP(+)) [Pyrinomonadaceae bacterium]
MTGTKESTELKGLSLIGGIESETSETTFQAVEAATGNAIGPEYHSVSLEDVGRAVRFATSAASCYAKLSNARRAAFLKAIAENLEAECENLVKRASVETGLPEARFEGELARTCSQLRMFADVAAAGNWVDARIDRADPERKPLPKPDVRSMHRPIGPVAVFCASNFPLAFSVAGGDTASALAAGCPVVVVANASHPGTAEIAGRAIMKAVSESNLDGGVFSLLFSSDHSAGQELVKQSGIKAVGFTGSRNGGRALMNIAAARPEPIPVYAEMSSVNPMFLLPDELESNPESIAEGLFTSFTLGCGQFCTKPGLVFYRNSEGAETFERRIAALVGNAEPLTLLNESITNNFKTMSAKRAGVEHAASNDVGGLKVGVNLYKVSATDFLGEPAYSEEMFGPSTILVAADNYEQLSMAANALEGQLTVSLHGSEDDLAEHRDLLDILNEKAGRIVINGYPTGVEVCGAIVHGGPFPATSDGRSTSVGKRAITRFARLVAYQNFPDKLLPEELRDNNPLGIRRIEE